MSKYKNRGAYHYTEFNDATPYRLHVNDLVETIKRYYIIEYDDTVLEVGAGEGLILSRLEREGFNCFGCDIDRVAVKLAKQLGNNVKLGTIDLFYPDSRFNVVLLADVLEHVDDPEEVIKKADAICLDLLVIAIPDRHDPHANQQIDPEWVKKQVGKDRCIHQTRRHARYLMVFKHG